MCECEDNYTMVVISAFAALSGLGDAVSASKLATKGAKAAELCNIIKKIGCAVKVAENAGEFGINANNAYKDIKEGTVGIDTFASLFAAGLNAFGIYASVKRFNSISVNTGKVTDGVEGVNKAEEKYHIGLGNDLDNYDYNKANKDYESIMSGGSSSKTSYGKSSGKYKSTADYLTNIESRNGKFYTDKVTIDQIGQIEARGEDFSLLNRKIMSSRASTEGGTSIVYKYSDELGTKYLIHEVTDAKGYIIHRDFDAVRLSSGQLINKGY